MSNGSASLRIISGVGTKGPACFLLEASGKRLMLDLGEGPPPGVLPSVDGLGAVDALILSHGHKDHVGGLSLLPKIGNPPVYATDIVARGLPQGLAVRPLPVCGTSDVAGIAVETGRDGHAPGGVWLRFATVDGFLYTGDYCVESILYAADPLPQAATLLFDASYGDYDETLAECWNKLTRHLTGQPLLLPVPANGRGPEIALNLARHGYTDLHVDEPMVAALRRLSHEAKISMRNGLAVEIEKIANIVQPIERPRGIMLAGSGDGLFGTTARLLAEWEHAAEPAIIFTGYLPPGSPGDRLCKSGRADFVRWNVHPRLSDAAAMVRAVKAETAIPAFCDRDKLEPLAAAFAPARVTMDAVVRL